MSNSNIRILVILAILTSIGMISTQIYWVNRAIAQQDQVFTHNVQVALRNVVESLCESSGKEFPLDNPIEQVSKNYFIVRTNDRIDLKLLEYLITAEIRERSITEDFEYGVYDCQNDQMVYADNINLVSGEHKDLFPELNNEEYYFGVYFPSKSKTISGELDIWKFTTVLTAVVILFFGYGLFIILRQKRLSEIQRDFINNVTHELKTPLSTLSLASSTLLERVPKEGRKYAEIINEETTRLQGHVEKILKGSILERHTKTKKEQIRLSDFFNQLLERCRQQYLSQMISWSLDCDDVTLNLNKDLLDNVVSNLIDNAVKYGASNISIRVKSGSMLCISVSDDAMGIPKKYLKQIFNRFFRVPDSKEQHNVKGFGLGLYIVKTSVKRLKGKIEVESEEGSGSTFVIKIPND